MDKVLKEKQQEDARTLTDLIEDMNWPKLRTAVHERPEELKEVNELYGYGWTILHFLCAVPPVPDDIFQSVVELYPEATRLRGKKWGQTPLHVLCRNSQKSVRKVQIILKHMEPEDLLIGTNVGSTALHCACASHAWIPVLEELIQANPKIVLAKTYDQHTALVALFQAHLQTIPGHLQLVRILKGEKVEENHFTKFWEKVLLMATTAFKLSPNYSPDIEADFENYGLHGLQFLRAPLQLQQVAIKLHPEWVSVADSEGNYPLHNAVIRKPIRIKDVKLIRDLATAYPEAASKRNTKGEEPIFIALRERMAWDAGIEALVKAQPEILSSIDSETGLYPFLLAASLDGKVALETTYQLLCANPHLAKI
eukprot:CAMPEP_0113614734 /NCGR_PEP_ID=MMETSP0017_2-20120614/7327_1 /TAXON_ID=2856 /ORGANISM="Cylindrotheca closterium" /LENGTH=366 /DNA_ID=CAMNT_0000523927 /DNA_START=76 /DNA_END=1176 /DNA_ORIENTATION=- /assembly_acc=CAM_ASM_000147